MIKGIVQKIKIKKIEKSENFFQRGNKMKKRRLRAFARTRAKKFYVEILKYVRKKLAVKYLMHDYFLFKTNLPCGSQEKRALYYYAFLGVDCTRGLGNS